MLVAFEAAQRNDKIHIWVGEGREHLNIFYVELLTNFTTGLFITVIYNCILHLVNSLECNQP